MSTCERYADHGDGIVLVTGATGLLGVDVVRRWATGGAARRLVVLVRDRARWQLAAHRAGIAHGAVIAVDGDVTAEGLGLSRDVRRWLAQDTTAVVHLAADTTFWRPLDESRRVNREGTAHLLAQAADWPRVTRLAFVSTAFVAGRRMGFVPESADGAATEAIGWVNAHERSKAEAESLVRAARNDWVILRSSTVACDDQSGFVTQRNALHQALRLFHDGLAALIPGVADSVLDVVPTDYVSEAIARLALRGGIDETTVHLCAGSRAMQLNELLDECRACWMRDPAWRQRGIALPALADLERWELFVRAVEETGHPRLGRVTRALTHFLPQLALPKCFETRRADELLGATAPRVSSYWGRMVDHLQRTGWRGVAGLAEEAA
jgi:nucleoside-diphosphate-sugar epimerase